MDRNRQAVAKSNVTEREGLYDPRTRKANPPPSVCSLGASPYAADVESQRSKAPVLEDMAPRLKSGRGTGGD
jgi:hypothetical protein